ncbi:microsomal signal peptidase 12kDa subunit [Microthyrium microscopicum]|uniref:Signal peptidase complex subunit 1 n=1 Tax=Microthyrium microscopicum TaxID=703497 RepID=A0A6A6U5H4_9PEZI|nr:microsomal signal peptidase 12kDa subunit [Microthyrium microscopicum]
MDEILDQARDIVEAPIDFQGQKLAVLVNYGAMSAFGVASFLTGLTTSNVYYALYVGLAGLVVTMLAVVPPWPMYNRTPVKWLPSRKATMWVTDEQKKSS